MILCDIGNTTYSFYLKKKNLIFPITTKLHKLPDVDDKIYFISVNNKATKLFQKKYQNAINIQTIFSYKTKYIGMGIDRQVACFGIKDSIIVDIGSAITVDIIKNGKHLGGFILPGIKKLTNLYPNISSKLKFDFEKNTNLDKIPNNTKDAINYAILQSLILPIKNIQLKHNLPLIITGGDAKYLSTYFKQSKVKRNLIFKAMKKIIKQKDKNVNNSFT